MPELPEVETTRRGLQCATAGRQIMRAVVRRRDLRSPVPETLAEVLEGATITGVRRRAKYLLLDLDTGQSMLAHLGMSGSFVVRPGEYRPQTHDHLLIYLDNEKLICFNDPRRFGVIDVLQTGQEQGHALLSHLGPEPLSDDFSVAYLSSQLARRTGAIKPVLMDQKLVVGVGNIYASEALHFCGIHPDIPASELSGKSAKMIEAIRATLEAAIASGGSTLRDYVGAQNEAGYFQHHFRVYDRAGDPCFECGTTIQTKTHAGRSTYWCPQCQQIRRKRQKS